jgi:hypothetical protein
MRQLHVNISMSMNNCIADVGVQHNRPLQKSSYFLWFVQKCFVPRYEGYHNHTGLGLLAGFAAAGAEADLLELDCRESQALVSMHVYEICADDSRH